MKTVNCSISEKRLKEIIREELERKQNKLNEDVDFEGAKTVVTGASKLLKAVIAFKEDANGGMSSAVTPHLDALKSALEAMVSNPGNYTDKVKVEPKRVKLRQVKEGLELDTEVQRLTNERPTPELMSQLSDAALETAKQKWPGSRIAIAAGHELLKRRSASGDSEASKIIAMANSASPPNLGRRRR